MMRVKVDNGEQRLLFRFKSPNDRQFHKFRKAKSSVLLKLSFQ
jgi:hypothetical protein